LTRNSFFPMSRAIRVNYSDVSSTERYFRANPGWQLMFVPRAIVIFCGSKQPGRPRQPRKLEPDAGRASSLTTVPTAKNAEHVPAPFPRVIVQLIPVGCEVTTPLPLPPGRIEMLPFAYWNAVHTVITE